MIVTLVTISLRHFLPHTESLVLNLLADGKEGDRNPLGEPWPKGNWPSLTRLLRATLTVSSDAINKYRSEDYCGRQ